MIILRETVLIIFMLSFMNLTLGTRFYKQRNGLASPYKQAHKRTLCNHVSHSQKKTKISKDRIFQHPRLSSGTWKYHGMDMENWKRRPHKRNSELMSTLFLLDSNMGRMIKSG